MFTEKVDVFHCLLKSQLFSTIMKNSCFPLLIFLKKKMSKGSQKTGKQPEIVRASGKGNIYWKRYVEVSLVLNLGLALSVSPKRFQISISNHFSSSTKHACVLLLQLYFYSFCYLLCFCLQHLLQPLNMSYWGNRGSWKDIDAA